MLDKQVKQFVINLNPEQNPFYKYALICNPFVCGNHGEQRLEIEKGLASGCSKADLDKFLPQIGVSGKEAIETIKKNTKNGHKYRVTVEWNPRTAKGGVRLEDLTEAAQTLRGDKA